MAGRGGIFDRVTASATVASGTLSAVLQLSGPSVEFTDAAGRPVDRLRFGSPAYVRVDDPGLDEDPGQVDTGTVQVGDEYLPLTETAAHTGIFFGSLPLVQTYSTSSNGLLEVASPDQVLTLLYLMPNPWGGYLMRRIQATGAARLVFLDAAGGETAAFLEGEELRLRLLDFEPARSPTGADQVQGKGCARATGASTTNG